MIVICVRRTLPWEDDAAAMAGLDPELRPKAELWNATFEMRYAAFRRRLLEITLESVSRVANAKRVRLEDAPPGALVVPVDDDDWFSPELASRLLAEHDPAFEGYLWTRCIFEANRRAPRWRWLLLGAGRRRDTSRWTCATNNYALRNRPGCAKLVTSHVAASEYFDANPRRIKTIEASLSVQNRNPASQTALGPWRAAPLTRDDLIASLARHRALYAHLRLPAELAWARPYVAAMRELTGELRLR